MTAMEFKSGDIKIFSDAAIDFFTKTTGHKAAVRTAYMLDGEETVVWNDFQGRIELSGQYRGSVTFSAPRGLLSHVLLLMGESDYTDDSHHDIVGEIANQMSGYARRHFGETMDISPPRAISQVEGVTPPGFEAAPFVIPMLWNRYEAHLVVRMGKAASA